MKPDTIDLRGLEQSIARHDAEVFAATKGYTMYFFGDEEFPRDVDLTLAVESHLDYNQYFWTEEEWTDYETNLDKGE